jgi:hypothetical protein
MLHMAELLLHSDDVPEGARMALATALTVPADQRRSSLLEAARILATDVGIGCEDACELVGLSFDASACD